MAAEAVATLVAPVEFDGSDVESIATFTINSWKSATKAVESNIVNAKQSKLLQQRLIAAFRHLSSINDAASEESLAATFPAFAEWATEVAGFLEKFAEKLDIRSALAAAVSAPILPNVLRDGHGAGATSAASGSVVSAGGQSAATHGTSSAALVPKVDDAIALTTAVLAFHSSYMPDIDLHRCEELQAGSDPACAAVSRLALAAVRVLHVTVTQHGQGKRAIAQWIGVGTSGDSETSKPSAGAASKSSSASSAPATGTRCSSPVAALIGYRDYALAWLQLQDNTAAMAQIAGPTGGPAGASSSAGRDTMLGLGSAVVLLEELLSTAAIPQASQDGSNSAVTSAYLGAAKEAFMLAQHSVLTYGREARLARDGRTAADEAEDELAAAQPSAKKAGTAGAAGQSKVQQHWGDSTPLYRLPVLTQEHALLEHLHKVVSSASLGDWDSSQLTAPAAVLRSLPFLLTAFIRNRRANGETEASSGAGASVSESAGKKRGREGGQAGPDSEAPTEAMAAVAALRSAPDFAMLTQLLCIALGFWTAADANTYGAAKSQRLASFTDASLVTRAAAVAALLTVAAECGVYNAHSDTEPHTQTAVLFAVGHWAVQQIESVAKAAAVGAAQLQQAASGQYPLVDFQSSKSYRVRTLQQLQALYAVVTAIMELCPAAVDGQLGSLVHTAAALQRPVPVHRNQAMVLYDVPLASAVDGELPPVPWVHESLAAVDEDQLDLRLPYGVRHAANGLRAPYITSDTMAAQFATPELNPADAVSYLWPARPQALRLYVRPTFPGSELMLGSPNLVAAMVTHAVNVRSRVRQLPALLGMLCDELVCEPHAASGSGSAAGQWSCPPLLDWMTRTMSLTTAVHATIKNTHAELTKAAANKDKGKDKKDKGKDKSKDKRKSDASAASAAMPDDASLAKVEMIEAMETAVQAEVRAIMAQEAATLTQQTAEQCHVLGQHYQSSVALHDGLGSSGVLASLSEAFRALPPGQTWDVAETLANALEAQAAKLSRLSQESYLLYDQNTGDGFAEAIGRVVLELGQMANGLAGVDGDEHDPAFVEDDGYFFEYVESPCVELAARYWVGAVLRMRTLVLLMCEFLRNLPVGPGAASSGKALHLSVRLSYSVTLRMWRVCDALEGDHELEDVPSICLKHTLLSAAAELHTACTDVALTAVNCSPVRRSVPTLFPTVPEPAIRGQEQTAPHSPLLVLDALWPMAVLLPVARTFGPVAVPDDVVPDLDDEDDEDDEDSDDDTEDADEEDSDDHDAMGEDQGKGKTAAAGTGKGKDGKTTGKDAGKKPNAKPSSDSSSSSSSSDSGSDSSDADDSDDEDAASHASDDKPAALTRAPPVSYYILRVVRLSLALRKGRHAVEASIPCLAGSGWSPVHGAREASMRLAISRVRALHTHLAGLAATAGLPSPAQLSPNATGMQSIQSLLTTIVRQGGPMACEVLELAGMYLPGPVVRSFFDDVLEPTAFQVLIGKSGALGDLERSQWRLALLRDARLYAIPSLARQIGPALVERIREVRSAVLMNFSVAVSPANGAAQSGQANPAGPAHAVTLPAGVATAVTHGRGAPTVEALAKSSGISLADAAKQLKAQSTSQWFIASYENLCMLLSDVRKLVGLLSLAASLPKSVFQHDLPQAGDMDDSEEEAGQEEDVAMDDGSSDSSHDEDSSSDDSDSDSSSSSSDDDKSKAKAVKPSTGKTATDEGTPVLQLTKKDKSRGNASPKASPRPAATVPGVNPSDVFDLLNSCGMLVEAITIAIPDPASVAKAVRSTQRHLNADARAQAALTHVLQELGQSNGKGKMDVHEMEVGDELIDLDDLEGKDEDAEGESDSDDDEEEDDDDDEEGEEEDSDGNSDEVEEDEEDSHMTDDASTDSPEPAGTLVCAPKGDQGDSPELLTDLTSCLQHASRASVEATTALLSVPGMIAALSNDAPLFVATQARMMFHGPSEAGRSGFRALRLEWTMAHLTDIVDKAVKEGKAAAAAAVASAKRESSASGKKGKNSSASDDVDVQKAVDKAVREALTKHPASLLTGVVYFYHKGMATVPVQGGDATGDGAAVSSADAVLELPTPVMAFAKQNLASEALAAAGTALLILVGKAGAPDRTGQALQGDFADMVGKAVAKGFMQTLNSIAGAEFKGAPLRASLQLLDFTALMHGLLGKKAEHKAVVEACDRAAQALSTENGASGDFSWVGLLARALDTLRANALEASTSSNAEYSSQTRQAYATATAMFTGLHAIQLLTACAAAAPTSGGDAVSTNGLTREALRSLLAHVPASSLTALAQAGVTAATSSNGSGLTAVLDLCHAVIDAGARAHDVRHFAAAEAAAAAAFGAPAAGGRSKSEDEDEDEEGSEDAEGSSNDASVEGVPVVGDNAARDDLLALARQLLPVVSRVPQAPAGPANATQNAQHSALRLLHIIVSSSRLLPLRSTELHIALECMSFLSGAVTAVTTFRPTLATGAGAKAVDTALDSAMAVMSSSRQLHTLPVDLLDVDIARGYGGAPELSSTPVAVACGTAAVKARLATVPAVVGKASTGPEITSLPGQLSGAAFQAACMTVHAFARFRRDTALAVLPQLTSLLQQLVTLALTPLPHASKVPAATLASIGREPDGYYSSVYVTSLSRSLEQFPRLFKVARYNAVHVLTKYTALASIRRAVPARQKAQLSTAEVIAGMSVPQRVRDALKAGVYAVLDSCRPAEMQAIHTALGALPGSAAHAARAMLKSLHKDYEHEHKYTGKA